MNKRYTKFLIQLLALSICGTIVLILVKKNDTRGTILETNIKPKTNKQNFEYISDLHTISCLILPVLGEFCMNNYSEDSIIKKDLNQNRYKYKNSFKKCFQFGTSKYLIIKRLKTIDDPVLEHILTKPPTDEDYKKLTLLNQTLYLTYDHLDTSKAITSGAYKDIDVLFGESAVDPRLGYNILDDVVFGENEKQPMYLSAHHMSDATKKEDMKFNGKTNKILLTEKEQAAFKILQIADLHYAIGKGKCKDVYPEDKFEKNCEADVLTTKFIDKILDIEKPNFVVFSGDQIMGDLCTDDSQSCLLKVIDPLVKRKINYTMIWGNHDDEGSLSREQLSKFAETLPYSQYQHTIINEDEINGYGNNLLKMQNEDEETILKLFLLDSHKYSPKPKIYPGYDWIKEEQWDYLTKMNDASDDSINIAFYHIPLPEYKDSGLDVVNGEYREGVTSPKYDYGTVNEYFTKNDIKLGLCGHDHVNDYCGKTKDTEGNERFVCYGGATGMGGYAGYGGYERRVRIINVDFKKNTIETYKRVMGNEKVKIDELVINK